MLSTLCSKGTQMPTIEKKIGEEDVSRLGAFSSSSELVFTLRVPRRLGAVAVVMRLCPDGDEDRDLPLDFCGIEAGEDIYRLSLSLGELCGEAGRGLFYYEFLFLRGQHTLFTDSVNNVDFALSEHSERRFRLLVYRPEERSPLWFRGATMYHIFVDRFRRGAGKVGMREDAVLCEDWERGIPQYPKKQGERYPNNVFFGGNLWGVAEKLDELSSLGVNVLYLSPIFRAYSNHKYDTGDYLAIDEMFGGEEAFSHLLREADRRGMRVILDGVFNHTGDDSRYFDRYGKYGGVGAYADPASPYRDWFCFHRYPEEYDSWWGIDILPRLNAQNEDCRAFFTSEDGVGVRYVNAGCSGWRLDVADELCDEFLDEFCASVKSARPDALIIGEVWENAADKTAYGKRRRYFQGGQLDSVMNYPFRTALLDYLRFRDAAILGDTLTELYGSYPLSVSHSLMNLVGTHDTERILTVLGGIADEAVAGEGLSNDELSVKRMNEGQRRAAKRLLRMAATAQFTVFGVPSVYYGDEAGLEGYHDPFCRMPYPWGREDKEVLSLYGRLGQIRRENPVFADGDFRVLLAEGGVLVYERSKADARILVILNREDTPFAYELEGEWRELLSESPYEGSVEGNGVAVLQREA